MRRFTEGMMLYLTVICRIIVWTLSWLCRWTFGQIIPWPITYKRLNRSKSEINFVGLNNQGATCYLNTLLQTWFMTREVKDCINRSQTQDDLIDELKNLFEQLAIENDNPVCTKSLTSCLELNVSKQCDIEVCFRNLMSKLSTRMDEENNILKIYQVTMVHSMKCSECEIPLDKESLFLDIPLSMCSATSFVKFKCMEESLHEFLSEEMMEGDNKCYCDACDKKTESTSRYYFKTLPQILTFQLKRFEFDCYCMRYRKIEDCINLPSDLVFKKSQDDSNEWCPVYKEHLGSNKRCYDVVYGGQGSFSTQQLQNGTSKDCGGRTSEEAQDQSEQDSTEQKLKKQKTLNMEMEDRDISVDNIDLQGQLKIKEEASTSIKAVESTGQPGIYPRQPREESEVQYNHSLEAMKRAQSEISPRQRQKEYSVNAEGRMTEAAPGQSEQDSTEDKKAGMGNREISVDNIDVQGQLKIKEEVSTSIMVDKSPGQLGICPRLPREESNAQYNHSLEAMERGQSDISPLEGQEEYSMNGEGRMTEAAPGQSEQDSTEDKKDMENNIDVQGQLKIKEEVLTSINVDESPGQPGIYPRLPREESNAQYNHSLEAMEQRQIEISPLQWQEEYSVNGEGRMTEAAPGQSEQDSTEDKKKDMEHREISVDNIDVQGQLKIKEEVSTSIKADEYAGQPGIYPRLPREESKAQYSYSFKSMERGQSEISPLQRQEELSANAEGRMTEAAPGQSEQDSTEDKKDLEHREISVDNIDVQGQLKIKEEVSMSIKVDESPGQPGIYPRLPREESKAQYNYSFKSMERGQSEISPLPGQEEYSVSAEGRMTEAAPGQSEQDSTEDKKKDMEHREISVDNIDVQGQLKIKEEVSMSIKVDESPGQPGIYPRLPREESKAQYNYSFKSMERGQSEISPLPGQEEYSVSDEGRMTEAAPGQSEQDSTEDKEKKYELFAIWHHRGSYGGGHYIAEIKSGSGDWYSFDDTFVKKIGKNINLRSTTAYMVMYRLVDTKKETGSDATAPEQCQTQNPYPEHQNCNELAENYFYI